MIKNVWSRKKLTALPSLRTLVRYARSAAGRLNYLTEPCDECYIWQSCRKNRIFFCYFYESTLIR